MTKLLEILAEGVAEGALATCAIAQRVLRLTGMRPCQIQTAYPAMRAMRRHRVPPIE